MSSNSSVTLGRGVTFSTANGGTITMIGDAELGSVGVVDGYAQYDDFLVDPEVDMTLDVSDDYDVHAEVQHITGEAIMSFGLTSRQPNGRADIRLTGLKPGGWYRLRFNNLLAMTAAGRAHGQASDAGVLGFTGVHVPNE